MSNNYEKSSKEEPSQQFNAATAQKTDTPSLSTKRIIEIPVKHFSSTNANTASSGASPVANSNPTSNTPVQPNLRQTPTNLANPPQNPQDPFLSSNDFFNRPSLFDDFNSPFDFHDSRFGARSLLGRDRFGFDDFFRPHLGHQSQSSLDPFFSRSGNSPAREVYSPQSNRPQTGAPTQPAEPNEAAPTRTESPKVFATQSNIIPNVVNPQPAPSAGIPIPIKHISTSPQRTDIKSQTSDFKHQIPVKIRTDSPKRQVTPPKTVIDHPQDAQKQPQFQQFQKPTQPAQPQPVVQPQPVQQPAQQQKPKPQAPPPTQQPPPQQQEAKMGNTFAGSHKRHHPANAEQTSDFAYAQTSQPPPPPQPSTAQSKIKTAQDKCDEIAGELSNLDKQVSEFQGKKDDKNYLKLDEYLTRCLLKLDEIDRSDDKVNQLRKRLINLTHQLLEKLEARATGGGVSCVSGGCETPMETAVSNENEAGNENPPSSKRSKSPAYDNQAAPVAAESTNEPQQTSENPSQMNAESPSSDSNNKHAEEIQVVPPTN